MKCPIDQTTLVIADRQGIEIDYCSQCRGVWLDRGELDKMIERSTAAEQSRHEVPRHEDRPREYRQEDHRQDDHDDRRSYGDDDYHHGKKRKKEGFLGDLFDF